MGLEGYSQDRNEAKQSRFDDSSGCGSNAGYCLRPINVNGCCRSGIDHVDSKNAEIHGINVGSMRYVSPKLGMAAHLKPTSVQKCS
jgi:hypothetical protein